MINRRRLLQIGGLAGLSVFAPGGVRKLRADGAKYTGPFWIMVNAGGAWDPTYLFDPKGGTMGDKTTINQLYAAADIKKAGAVSYAPVPNGNTTMNAQFYSNDAFFQKYASRFAFLNGVDTQTNNHDTGSRCTWSGQLGEGFPSLAAVIAGVAMETTPVSMAYISNGGYDATANIVPLTRSGSVDAIQRIAYSDRIDPTMTDTFHTPTTTSRIAQAQLARLQAMQKAQGLPSTAQSMGSLYLARSSDSGLDALAQQLSGTPLVTLSSFSDLKSLEGNYQYSDLESLIQQAQLALLAFQAGVAVSVNLNIGGFDTHSDHDNQHLPQLMKVLRAVSYLLDTADAMGLSQNLYVVVGSDFARTPYYNAGNGKDHWNITSMMVAGPGIKGGQVIGSTDAGFKQVLVDPTTLAPTTDASGVSLQPQHVHLALRKLAKIDTSDLATSYALAGPSLPLFGA